jgi:hypothetical protein
MKLYLYKKFLKSIRQYIFIFITATIFTFSIFSKCIAEENVFTISNVEVKGVLDLNFSREKYINKAFLNSFKLLMGKILLKRDFEKINNVKILKIKKLAKSFQILEETYSKNEYKLITKIIYDDIAVKKFLSAKNISFSQPENITVVFYPVLFVDSKIQAFNENFFYKNWTKIKIKNELINFIMPVEDLEDILKISEAKEDIEKLNIKELVNKYDIKNYVFALMDYQEKILNVYIKTNFNNNKISKNFSYQLDSINDTKSLNSVSSDLKSKITDLWKEENLINLLMPLSIQIHYNHKNIENLNKLQKVFKKISIINDFNLEKFSINTSLFKIYYYGNPKKLRSDLLKFGYILSNEQGFWQIYLDE